MLIGHLAAGKTSVKRSLLGEEFEDQHLTTDGVDTHDTCVVNVDTAINWQKGRPMYNLLLTVWMCIQALPILTTRLMASEILAMQPEMSIL